MATGALLGAAAVVMGAVGAHGLDALAASGSPLADPHEIWQSAVRYLFVHALGSMVIGLFMPSCQRPRLLAGAWALIAGGSVLFSGSLYAMVLAGTRDAAVLAPVGGGALIVGWLLLAGAAIGGSGPLASSPESAS